KRRHVRWNKPTPVTQDLEVLPENCLGGCRPHAYDDLGSHCFNLRIQPWPAGLNLRVARLLVDSPLAALVRSPVEMLHSVGHVHFGAVDSCCGESLVENSSRRANEGMAAKVFLVTGLLADQHDGGSLCSFSENGLRGMLVKVAALAGSSSRAKRGQSSHLGQKRGRSRKQIL